MFGYFKRPRVQDVQPGEALPAEAGGMFYGRYVAEVFHGHYPFYSNYARFMLEDGTEVEFLFGRQWERCA